METRISRLGGKAVNLVELQDAGFPVPPFVVLDTAEYFTFVSDTGVSPIITRAMQLPAAQAAEAIRAAFRRPMPEGQRARISSTIAPLLDRPVAVRSSATAEDLPEASFAGLQDSFLDVRGLDAALAAIIECWSSLWTERAITYRARNQISGDGLGLAVIVQEMVDAEAAGVMFTADPLSGHRGRIVVEAVPGLAEKLVGGLATPNIFTIEIASHKVLEQSVQGARPTLSAGQLQRLARLGQRIAAHFGQPQDIEWTLADDRLAVVQTRPVTSLYPLPEGPAEALWLSFGGFQGMLDPISPLGADVLLRAITQAAPLFGGQLLDHRANPYLQPAGERLWVRFDRLARGPAGRAVVKLLAAGDPAAAELLTRLAAGPESAHHPIRGRLRLVRSLGCFVLPRLPRVIAGLRNPDAARANFTKLTDDLVAEVGQRFDAAAGLSSPPARLAARVGVLEWFTEQCFRVLLPAFAPMMAPSMGLLLRLRWLAHQTGLPDANELAMRVLRSVPGNVTTEMDLALYATARAIAGDELARQDLQATSPDQLASAYLAGTLPEPAQAALADFLSRYGMRGVAEIDLGAPRWREDPAAVIGTIQSFIDLPAEAAPDLGYQRGKEEAAATVDQIATGLPGLRAAQARLVASRVRGLFGVRETPKFTIVRALSLARSALQQSGDDLVAAGVLGHRDDVFFLRVAELTSAHPKGTLRDAVATRRQAAAREARRTRIPIVMVGDGRTFYTSSVGDPDADLSGLGVSPGTVEGPVRIVTDPRSAQQHDALFEIDGLGDGFRLDHRGHGDCGGGDLSDLHKLLASLSDQPPIRREVTQTQLVQGGLCVRQVGRRAHLTPQQVVGDELVIQGEFDPADTLTVASPDVLEDCRF